MLTSYDCLEKKVMEKLYSWLYDYFIKWLIVKHFWYTRRTKKGHTVVLPGSYKLDFA